MKKQSKRTLQLSLSAAIALSGGNAVAGDVQQEGFTLAPMIGYSSYSHEKQSLKNAGTVSLAAGYQFNSPWAVELAGQYSNPDQIPSGDAEVTQLRLDGLYHFAKDGDLQPFALFGVGKSEFDNSIDKVDDTLVNAGLGIKYAITNALSFRYDMRAVQQRDSDVTQLAANLGFNFLFGAKSAPAAPKAEFDSDNDGVIDRLDSCPASAAGIKVDATGCAMILDADKDGVIDSKDACPNTKPNAKVNEKGCYLVLKEDITIKLNVTFANNSDAVVSNTLQEIEPLATFMSQYPLTKVVIEGHTDSMGSAAYNQSLSQKRASAVANVLTETFNISADRISAVGFGEARPIATNDTAEGRAQNRRVEGVVQATVEKVAP